MSVKWDEISLWMVNVWFLVDTHKWNVSVKDMDNITSSMNMSLGNVHTVIDQLIGFTPSWQIPDQHNSCDTVFNIVTDLMANRSNLWNVLALTLLKNIITFSFKTPTVLAIKCHSVAKNLFLIFLDIFISSVLAYTANNPKNFRLKWLQMETRVVTKNYQEFALKLNHLSVFSDSSMTKYNFPQLLNIMFVIVWPNLL